MAGKPVPPELHPITAPTWLGGSSRWATWLVGVAALAAAIVVASHYTEERDFVRMLTQGRPLLLLLAFLLQAGTYFSQSAVWRTIARKLGEPVPRGAAFKLSLAQLFIDQAIPTGGVSGAAFAAQAMSKHGMSRKGVATLTLVGTATHYAAYALGLVAAAVILIVAGRTNAIVLALIAGFVVAVVAVGWAGWRRAGGHPSSLERKLRRWRLLRRTLFFIADFDPQTTKDTLLLVTATFWQLSIVLVDSATLWVILYALGAAAKPWAVFASFMLSSLARTLGIVPGGLGTFEAVSVATLSSAGISVAEALSATLLFRGLTFWLPMLPGFWYSRVLSRVDLRPKHHLGPYWSLGEEELLERLATGPDGLRTDEALRRLAIFGANEIKEQRSVTRARVLLNQIRSPLLLLLAFAAIVSGFGGQWVDAAIVLAILTASVGIGYSREHRSQQAVAALRARIQIRASVLRDGRTQSVPARDMVPGDVVLLAAGSLIAGDGVVLEATDFFVNEAVLTGESFPVEKKAGTSPPAAKLSERTNAVYMGTNARSGTARCLVVETGAATEFGEIAARLELRPPATEFDRGLQRFGYLLMIAMLLMILFVFVANVLLARPPMDTLLFSIALAVGLSPELLPAILSINLARGALAMSRQGVLVKRLAAIENLGSMNILCTDKTGTLTEGIVRLEQAFDLAGTPSPAVLAQAGINAGLQSGLPNPLDEAILQAAKEKVSGAQNSAKYPMILYESA